MGGIQTDVSDGDIWVDRLKFIQGDDGAETVVPLGVEETDVEREINAGICIMCTEHVKGASEEKDFLVVVPSPVSVWVGEIAPARTVRDADFEAFIDLTVIGGSMGTSTVGGQVDDVFWNERRTAKGVLIMEREFLMFERISGHDISNPGMLVGFYGRLSVCQYGNRKRKGIPWRDPDLVC